MLLPLLLSRYIPFVFFWFYYHTEHPNEKDTFSVGMNHHFHTTNGAIVKYNYIMANSNANVYNPLTGKFTASVDGTYLFHYHGLAQRDQV